MRGCEKKKKKTRVGEKGHKGEGACVNGKIERGSP